MGQGKEAKMVELICSSVITRSPPLQGISYILRLRNTENAINNGHDDMVKIKKKKKIIEKDTAKIVEFFIVSNAWLRFMNQLYTDEVLPEKKDKKRLRGEKEKLTRIEGIISFPEGWGVKKADAMAPAAAGRLLLDRLLL